MSAAVAQRNSPHMPRSSPRNKSPMDKKNAIVKTEEKAKKEPSLPSTKKETISPPRSDPQAAVKDPLDSGVGSKDVKPAASDAEATALPLAPPPRPSQANASSDPDYFSGQHNSHYSLEPNLFEQSFGNPPDTPGKSLLPPVASLTSPAPLTGNASLGGGYTWTSSLRSGPLSPAMLSEPQGPRDYFDSSLRGSFPTPNESSLRTGLTPGGGGSMFPAPSPNSQALFNSLLASGGATPSTLDFHRTAINAAAANKSETNFGTTSTTQSQNTTATTMAMESARQAAATVNGTASTAQPFAQHDNEAANGLYLLAQAGNESQSSNQFAMPNQPAHVNPAHEAKRARNAPGSMDSSAHGQSEISGERSDNDTKSGSRKSKRAATGKGGNRRKADETPSKQPPAKKTKSAPSSSMMDLDMGMESDEEIREETHDENGRKMTDEEKRKNFLERNRVAALKCRQRKKQWLANLQAKVEIFSTENDALTAQVTSLREEILNLKTILIAHKDCPIAQQQQNVGAYIGHNQPDYANHPNPYGMSMQGQPVMAGPRRYS